MELYDVSSPVEQNLLIVLVELNIILDHGINLQGTARKTVKPFNQNKHSRHPL